MLEYNDEKHEYWLDGVLLPSVTKLLQDCGIIENRFFTEEGANNGKRRHLCTELYDKDDLDWGSVIEADVPFLQAWIQFKKDKDVIIQGIEEKMYHPLLQYAGCLDRLASIGDRPYILDIKTGQKAKWHELQLILYGLMVANDGEKPNLMTVYLKKNCRYAIQEYDYTNERFALAAIRIAQWKNK